MKYRKKMESIHFKRHYDSVCIKPWKLIACDKVGFPSEAQGS